MKAREIISLQVRCITRSVVKSRSACGGIFRDYCACGRSRGREVTVVDNRRPARSGVLSTLATRSRQVPPRRREALSFSANECRFPATQLTFTIGVTRKRFDDVTIAYRGDAMKRFRAIVFSVSGFECCASSTKERFLEGGRRSRGNGEATVR